MDSAAKLLPSVAELIETGLNGSRAMGGDFGATSLRGLRPDTGRSAEGTPTIGIRCVTK